MEFSSKYAPEIDENIDSASFFKENILFYLKKIHWFILSMLICLIVANVKLKYETPLYQASSKVLFKSSENSELFNESSAFQDLGYGYNFSPIENEIETLKSRSLMKKVVQDLKLNVVFYKNDGYVLKEEYDNPSLKVTFLSGDSSIYDKGARFDLTITSENTFDIENENDKFKLSGSFGKPIQTKMGEIILTPASDKSKVEIGKKIVLYVYELEDAVNMYAGGIIVEKANEYSNVLEISLIDNSIKKAKDIVNSIVIQHQIEAIDDKNQVAKNSANFINDRISIISKELSDVEGNVQNFKSSNSIVDVSTEVTLFMETQQEIEKSIVENEIQLKLAEYVNSYLENKVKSTELLPSNLGLNDLSIEHSIETYNNLVLERNRILKNSNERNPIAINLETKILNLQDNLILSIKKYAANLKIRGNQLNLRNKKMGNQISAVPKKEKELREIQRQQQIKESLYLYLLQKREETAITLSLTVANSRVIDEAFSTGNAVSPSKKNFYLIAIILGFFIPLVLFFILKKLNNKIHSSADIEKYGLNVLCEIPKSSENKKNVIFATNESSSISESFRLLRTNLDFLLSLDKPHNKVIVITSTLPKEGKSFITLNLAKSLGILNKKVLVIGLDLRSPTLYKYLDISSQIGVTNYIVNDDLTVENITIKNVQNHKFDLILSGDIPPNPSEILMHPRVQQLFDEVNEHYDYIVIDTAPIGVVTDTLHINRYADLFLYIVRNKYLEKSYINFIKKIKKENKLKHVNIVLNCVDSNLNYGYGYGYYHSERKKTWLSKLMFFFKRK